MCERFTKRARAAFEVAVEIAQDEQADEVRPQHVFAALLRDPETLATKVLAELGASPQALGAELAKRRDRYAEGLGEEDAEALALSLCEAINFGHNYIGTKRILLGIVRGGDSVVRDTLTACGVETGGLRTAVKEAVCRAS